MPILSLGMAFKTDKKPGGRKWKTNKTNLIRIPILYVALAVLHASCREFWIFCDGCYKRGREDRQGEENEKNKDKKIGGTFLFWIYFFWLLCGCLEGRGAERIRQVLLVEWDVLTLGLGLGGVLAVPSFDLFVHDFILTLCLVLPGVILGILFFVFPLKIPDN